MGLVQGCYNYLRTSIFDGIGDKKTATDQFKLIETATVVTAVACVVFFLLAPKVSTFLFFGSLAGASYEIGLVARNFREILNNLSTRAYALLSRENRVETLGKGTALARLIFRIALPE